VLELPIRDKILLKRNFERPAPCKEAGSLLLSSTYSGRGIDFCRPWEYFTHQRLTVRKSFLFPGPFVYSTSHMTPPSSFTHAGTLRKLNETFAYWRAAGPFRPVGCYRYQILRLELRPLGELNSFGASHSAF
jgi:hypothetical protein